MPGFTLPGWPASFTWLRPPVAWRLEADGRLRMRAGPRSDWFTDPETGEAVDAAPVALAEVRDDTFLVSAHAAVTGGAAFDAAAIQIRAAEDRWAKLGVEYSPQGRPMIVSVVTRGRSDDANAVELAEPAAHLRVARTPQALAFHWSADGRTWHLVRHFSLGPVVALRAGFSVQSPRGEGCEAVFAEMMFRRARLGDLRSGE